MKVNEPMRQFMIDRAATLYYEAQRFPETRFVTAHWILRALRLARQAGDADLYRSINARLLDSHDRQISRVNGPRSDERAKGELQPGKEKTEPRVDSRVLRKVKG